MHLLWPVSYCLMSLSFIVSRSQQGTLFVCPYILVLLSSFLLSDLGNERSGAGSKLHGLKLARSLDCVNHGLLDFTGYTIVCDICHWHCANSLDGLLEPQLLGLLRLVWSSEQEFAVDTSRFFEDAVLDRPVQSTCLLLDLIPDEFLCVVVEEVLRAGE